MKSYSSYSLAAAALAVASCGSDGITALCGATAPDGCGGTLACGGCDGDYVCSGGVCVNPGSGYYGGPGGLH